MDVILYAVRCALGNARIGPSLVKGVEGSKSPKENQKALADVATLFVVVMWRERITRYFEGKECFVVHIEIYS